MRQSLEIRENMVFGQLKPQGVMDPALIDALTQLPREDFLPPRARPLSYLDESVSLKPHRALMPLSTLARLIQAARVSKSCAVLDIGCATGYSTAVLAFLAGKVTGLEPERDFAEAGAMLLGRFGVENAIVAQQSDLLSGYSGRAPYNVILVNGGLRKVPERLCQQLADGGRLVAVLSTKGRVGHAVRVMRHGDSYITESLFDAAVPMLPGVEREKKFTF